MSSGSRTLNNVVADLEADGALPESGAADAAALIERLAAVQPWYIRTMVGFGAWLASLLLIGFVAGFGLAFGGSTVVGLALVAGATWIRRQDRFAGNDFVVQCTLAVSLAGQALFGWGLADLLPGDEIRTGCVIVLAMSTLLFFLFPDRIHRVLMVLFAASALVTLAYAFEMNGAVPVIGPLFAAALVWLYSKRAALTAAGHGALVRPLASGLMLAAFGCLLLSTIYILPELGSDFTFYPLPWISTVLLGALFLLVGYRACPALLEGGHGARGPIAWLAMLLVIVAAWAAPGLLLALIVVLLGAASGHRTFIGAGIAFLVVFVGAYFYGIEITLLQKSITLVVTGIVILLARWLLLRGLGARDGGAVGARTAGSRGSRVRIIATIVMTAVILALVNLQIVGKERILTEGRTVLLRLAPLDPRSLLQGDYMALRYAMADEVAAAAKAAGVSDGRIVVELDEKNVARFVALDGGSRPLAAGQQLLEFRKRGETVRLASDAFFFEEGLGEHFAAARYGELRVAGDGTAVLLGLRDEEARPLAPP